MTDFSRRSFARFAVSALNGMALLWIHRTSCACLTGQASLASSPIHVSLRSALDAIPARFPGNDERWNRNMRKIQKLDGTASKRRMSSAEHHPEFLD